MCLRVASTSGTQETLHRGEILGVLETGVTLTSVASVSSATCEGNPLTDLKLGDELAVNQREDLMEILRKFQSVFYTGGSLSLVRVGV